MSSSIFMSHVSNTIILSALTWGCYDTLRTWQAVSKLSIPPHPPVSDDNSDSLPSNHPLTHRTWNFVTPIRPGGSLFHIAVAGIILFLTFFASPLGLDVFWFLYITAFYVPIILALSEIISQSPRSIEYSYNGQNLSLNLISNEPAKLLYSWDNRYRIIISFLTSLTVMTLNYAGFTQLRPLLGAAVVLTIMRVMVAPTLSIRATLKVIAMFEFGIPLVLAILLGMLKLAMYYFPDEPPSPDSGAQRSPTNNLSSPSQLAFIDMLTRIIPVLLPGFLVALNLRFDHHRSSTPDDTNTPLNPIRINKAVVQKTTGAFPSPVFSTSILALILSLFASDYLFDATAEGKVPRPLAMFVTIPSVVIVSALTAWWTGDFIGWLNYREVWIPKQDDELTDALSSPQSVGGDIGSKDSVVDEL